MSKWIRKGDRVLVIAGNNKGKTGEVISRLKNRVIVQGVNIRKKHMRPTQQTQGGRIVEMEMPIDISNVCVCDKQGEPMKLRVQGAPNKRELVYGLGNKTAVYRSVKKPG